MKSILFIACLVLVQGSPDAEPEADPYFYYNSGLNYPATAYHHGLPLVPKVVSPLTATVTPFSNTIHTPLIHQAVVKDVEVTPAEVKKEVTPLAQTFVSPYNVGFRYGTYGLSYTTGAYQYPAAPSYVANSGGAVHVVNKREADAEPEADPYFYYNNPTTTTYHHGIPNPAIAAVGAFPTTFANTIHTPFVHQAVVKEVEETPAEVKKEVTPLTKTFISPYNVGFGYGNYGFPYTAGAYQYPLATYATTPIATQAATVSAVRDAASPSYVANSGGAVHIVNKREADPEADAYHYYGNVGHHYGYGHYGYGHRYGYRRVYSGYYGYPYGYNRW